MEKQESNSKTGGSNKGVIAIAGVVIIALVGVIIYLVMKPADVVEEKTSQMIVDTADGRGTVLTPENKDEVLNAEPVEPGYMETRMTNEWTFVDGESQSNVYIANAESNRQDFYFEILVDNEVIYSSPYLPVGSEMPQFKLTKNLSRGDYNGIIKYHMVDEAKVDTSSVSIAVTLHIK